MELIRTIKKVQDLPEHLHWFCPRRGDEDNSSYFDEDLSGLNHEDEAKKRERVARVANSKDRKALILDALLIFAFDGKDATHYQEWLREHLDAQMTSCDICIREFHRGRRDLKHKLEGQYEEEEVDAFLEKFDSLNVKRIKDGLSHASQLLRQTPKEARGIGVLDSQGLYAIFEALSCEPFLINLQLLSENFDEPFNLVQARKRLRLSNYPPAMSHFLFQPDKDRAWWARNTWSKFRRNLTSSEFEWSVREPLHEAMMRVLPTNLDLPFLPSFWSGVRVIVEKLDQNLITHSLRAMEIDLFKLALDHLQVDAVHLPDLIVSITHVLRVSPADFWDSMGAISPNVVIEQIFNNPAMQKTLKNDENTESHLDDLFSWVLPFMISIKTDNQPRACRALTTLLLDTFQDGIYSQAVQSQSSRTGLQVLAETLRMLNEEASARKINGRAVAAEAMDVVKQHIAMITASIKHQTPLSKLKSQIIRRTLSLDVINLEIDKWRLQQDKPTVPDAYVIHAKIWGEMVAAVRRGGVALAKDILIGMQDLSILDKFFAKSGTALSENHLKFNSAVDVANGLLCQLLEMLGDFRSSELEEIFTDGDAATAVIMLLLAVDTETRQLTTELLKTLSGEAERKAALAHILRSDRIRIMESLSLTIRKISTQKVFPAASAFLKVGNDTLEVLCNSQTGLLLGSDFDSSSAKVTETFWQAIWQQLSSIFLCTEGWSTLGYDKSQMMEFCRDTMEFAERAFNQYTVFKAVVKDPETSHSQSPSTAKRLLQYPTTTMEGMVKWLRLRDEFLVAKSVALISNLLIRLQDVSIRLSQDALEYIEGVVMGRVKTTLSSQQKAELHRALEAHIGHIIRVDNEHQAQTATKDTKKKAEVIDLNAWRAKAARSGVRESDIDSEDSSDLAKVIASQTRSTETYRKMQEAKKFGSKPLKTIPNQSLEPGEFKRKRMQELAEKKKRDAEAIARLRKTTVGQLTAEGGSGLAGLGLQAKNHAVKTSSVMVSSSEESSEDDDDDDINEKLFGRPAKTSDAVKAYEADRARKKREAKQGPVKKQRLLRSARDMRARLAPDLSPLHKIVLGWEYFHNGDLPPNSISDAYLAVPNSFREPTAYRTTFEPLLTLEAWQGFVKAREESSSKPYGIKVVNRSTVDAFLEVSSTMSHADAKETAISEGDIVLLSKAKSPAASPEDPHALARVYRITRKKQLVEILYRVMPGSRLIQVLGPGADVHGVKITSIIPLEREYGALLGLEYYDLCEEIIKAKPSPLLAYSDQQVQSFMDIYGLNKAQAKAIKSAMDNDAFTLVQGPPGSGKTKTIVAIVGAILSESFRDNKGAAIQGAQMQNEIGQRGSTAPVSKKLLVCAPSNAAVDELVMRFKDGVKTTRGESKTVNIVRLGRSDAINTNVQDVTLDELVNKKLNINPDGNSARDETQKIMKEHQMVSEKLRDAREQLDKAESENSSGLAQLRKDFDALRRQKAMLGTKVDSARDNENAASRQADLNRRRAQQEIIDEAHVICATLSGSGHDMFQNLNVDFETVIIDEAAQCVELSCLIPLKYGCAKCILVGDPQQLPPTVFSKQAAQFKYEQSLFVRMQNNHPQDVHLLDTQYRMHPEISVFPSKAFYDGKLLDGKDMALLRQRPWHAAPLLGPFRFFDVQGQHQAAPKGHSLVNHAEVRIAMRLYERLTTDFGGYNFRSKIGVITPYKSQLRELKEQFKRQYGPGIFDTIEFNTTDAFQGRESEVIIFSCVRASPAGGIGFLQDIRRMNVGLTRAKSSLWVLGNSQSLIKGEYWRMLVEDSRRRNKYTDGNLEAILQNPSQITRSVEDGSSREIRASNGTSSGSKKAKDATRITDASRKPIGPGTKHTGEDQRMGGNVPPRTTTSSVSKLTNTTATSTPNGSKFANASKLSSGSKSVPVLQAKTPIKSPTSGSSSSDSDNDEDKDTEMTDAPAIAHTKLPSPKPVVASKPAIMPKKRKVVDPFIRPKVKKPRPGF